MNRLLTVSRVALIGCGPDPPHTHAWALVVDDDDAGGLLRWWWCGGGYLRSFQPYTNRNPETNQHPSQPTTPATLARTGCFDRSAAGRMMKRIIGALLLGAALAQAFLLPTPAPQQQQCLTAHRLSSRGEAGRLCHGHGGARLCVRSVSHCQGRRLNQSSNHPSNDPSHPNQARRCPRRWRRSSRASPTSSTTRTWMAPRRWPVRALID